MKAHYAQNEKTFLTQEIVVYRKRIGAIMYAAFFLLVLLLMVQQIFWSIQIQISVPIVNSFNLGDAIVLCLFLGAMFSVIWHMVMRQIVQFDPAITINRKGIQIGKLPIVFGGVVISWNEIGTIYEKRVLLERYFCIRPKNIEQYLSKLSVWKRVRMRIAMATSAGELIVVPQSCLKKSIKDILQDLRREYEHELMLYNIQIPV